MGKYNRIRKYTIVHIRKRISIILRKLINKPISVVRSKDNKKFHMAHSTYYVMKF